MSPRVATLSAPSRHLPGVWLLVLALLWAQLLGLAHGVRHAVPAAHEAAHAPVAAAGLLDHLLAPAGDDGDCRLYDQLGHGGPLPQGSVLAVAALPLLAAWATLPAPRPQPCAAFAARAPPRSR